MSQLDLNSLPADVQATLTRKETDGERRVRLFKDVVMFVLAIGLLAAIAGYCFHVLLASGTAADGRRWAQSVLGAIGGGIIGYLLRR